MRINVVHLAAGLALTVAGAAGSSARADPQTFFQFTQVASSEQAWTFDNSEGSFATLTASTLVNYVFDGVGSGMASMIVSVRTTSPAMFYPPSLLIQPLNQRSSSTISFTTEEGDNLLTVAFGEGSAVEFSSIAPPLAFGGNFLASFVASGIGSFTVDRP